MPLLFLIAAVVGVVALSRSAPAPASRAITAGNAPSPIAVLCAHLRADREPPPFVVRCAIAEAQLAGRHDLAQTFGQLLDPSHALSSGAIYAAPLGPAGQGRSFDGSAAHVAPPADMPQDDQTIETAPVAPASPPANAQLTSRSDGSAREPAVNIPSPIVGIDDGSWSHFCGALVRESPDFVSQRNVGRYRHRKDRLAQIGFDPDSIVGSPEAQDAAWNADLADAHHHLAASGMLRHIGRPIAVPVPDGAGSWQTIPVTLSGMLGVAGVAGLEGCAGWLENKADRKKFPHTTAAFLRSNGVF